MAIGLINTYSTLNVGDAAIYGALHRLLPQQTLLAQVQDQNPDQGVGVHFVSQLPRNCAAYISVGGDIFNNAREWFLTKAFLQNLNQLRCDPSRTLLFGQSIPRSCHGFAFLLLRQCLLSLGAVCVRDAESYVRLRQAGVAARLSFDTAFALECSPSALALARQLFSAQGLEPHRAAVVSVRGFDSLYRNSNARFLESMTNLCRGLQHHGFTPVLLIQSRAYGADNDLDIARQLKERVSGSVVVDPFVDHPLVPNWQLAMAVIALSELVVAVRYHTAVLALASGRVPYHLHYSNKGRDLCSRLALPGCNLGDMNPNAILPAVLATAGQTFDHQALRERVQRDFRFCLQQLPPSMSMVAGAG